jgi:hypothetical protein
VQREMGERRRTVAARLPDKAWKDAAFRRALPAAPTGTLERELGARLPAALPHFSARRSTRGRCRGLGPIAAEEE